ncbi:MAG: metal-dependent transcriptional regulator [Bryobacterales bacterium]|nr:metal-dependent transcriptional regulator [Bryobacterales bacterium]
MDTTISKENYLKAIAEAESEGEPVIAATIVRWLQVTPAAVTMAIRRLRRDGLVTVEPEGKLSLTDAGRQIAERIRFRHHLIERMLSEMFGMEWYKVHDEAERLEHAVSVDFEVKLVERLGKNGVCPHGNDIRSDSPADKRSRGLITLAEVEPLLSAAVECVYERDRTLLEYLDKIGIRPGVWVQVLDRNPDATVRLAVSEEQQLLGSSAAEKIWVRPKTESSPV